MRHEVGGLPFNLRPLMGDPMITLRNRCAYLINGSSSRGLWNRSSHHVDGDLPVFVELGDEFVVGEDGSAWVDGLPVAR